MPKELDKLKEYLARSSVSVMSDSMLLALLAILGGFEVSFASEAYWATSLTVVVFEGMRDCYFIPHIKKSKEIAVEFRVTNTKSVWAGANVNIGFKVYDSNERVLISGDDKSSGSYFLTAGYNGDYKVCLDNSIASPGNKAVYLQFEVADSLNKLRQLLGSKTNLEENSGTTEKYEGKDIENDDLSMIMEGNEDMLESFGYKAAALRMQLQDIRKNIRIASSIHNTVYQSTIAQSHLAENSLQSVNFWSFIHVIVLILTGLIQIFVMRSLFDDKMNMVKKVLHTK